jgi:hypothetical protein
MTQPSGDTCGWLGWALFSGERAKTVILSEETLVEARKERLDVALDRFTPDAAVMAVFLGGSLAARSGDAWSDIDLRVVVRAPRIMLGLSRPGAKSPDHGQVSSSTNGCRARSTACPILVPSEKSTFSISTRRVLRRRHGTRFRSGFCTIPQEPWRPCWSNLRANGLTYQKTTSTSPSAKGCLLPMRPTDAPCAGN